MNRGAGVVAGLVVVLGAGCVSSKSSPPDGSGGSGLTGCAAYAAKVCERFQTCAPGLMPLFGFASQAECVTFEQDGCEVDLTARQTGNSPALVQQCGDALGAMTCAEFLGSGSAAPCLPHGGSVANGGSCSTSWQCASGRCDALNFAQCGSCVPQAAAGQPCTQYNCADYLFCSASAPGASTTVCAPPVDIGGSCNDSAVCAGNAYCDSTSHQCTQRPAIGEACDPVTFYCDVTGPAALCDGTTSKCVAATIVLPGAECDTSNSNQICEGTCLSTAVDASIGACTALVPVGAACTSTDICAGGAACTGGICAPPVCDGTPNTTGAAAAVTTSLAARRLHLRF
jgi:hypothetical protein